MVIAIDGPAGAGKSTVAKLIAQKLGFLYIDTGAMYRALTLKAIEQGIDSRNEPALIEMTAGTAMDLKNRADGALEIYLDGREVSSAIREPRITKSVSDIAKIKGIREIMVKLQRKLGESRDAVLDGRDIGTVVFPDAGKKFYIDADFKERVRRRYKELKGLGQEVTLADIEKDLHNRDTIDSTRAVAPLKQAPDAIYIDTTNMSIKEVVNKLLAEIHDKSQITNPRSQTNPNGRNLNERNKKGINS